MNNNIIVHGRIGTEPELRFSGSGTAVLKFAVVDTYMKNNEKKNTWHNIVVFGKLAENVANSATKGTTIIVSGRMEQDEYTKKDGTKGKSVQIIADEVGVSCRWNSWVADKSETVMAEIGNAFPEARLVSNTDPADFF